MPAVEVGEVGHLGMAELVVLALVEMAERVQHQEWEVMEAQILVVVEAEVERI